MSTLPAGDWAVDTVHSDVAFEVQHNSLQAYRATFSDYSAELHTDDDGLGITGRVKVESVEISLEMLRDTVLGEDFLDAANHPEIVFTSSSIDIGGDGSLEVKGTLEMKGTSGEVTAKGKLTGPVNDLHGDPRVSVQVEAVIDRTEYGLAWQGELDGGEDVLGNEVKLIAHMELAQG